MAGRAERAWGIDRSTEPLSDWQPNRAPATL